MTPHVAEQTCPICGGKFTPSNASRIYDWPGVRGRRGTPAPPGNHGEGVALAIRVTKEAWDRWGSG